VLKREADSNLIDVRTEKELSSFGVPDLGSIGKSVNFIEWSQNLFSNTRHIFLGNFRANFSLERKGSFIFICKSGIRSNLAALTVEESDKSGNDICRFFNVIDGFEGSSNFNEFSNNKDGWKSLGLPWKTLK